MFFLPTDARTKTRQQEINLLTHFARSGSGAKNPTEPRRKVRPRLPPSEPLHRSDPMRQISDIKKARPRNAHKRTCKHNKHGATVGRKLDQDTIDKIVAALRSQATPNASVAVQLLAEQGIKVDLSTVCKYALGAGIDLGGQGRRHGAQNVNPGEGTKWSPVRDEILRLYARGKGASEISRLVGKSRALVHRYIKEASDEPK